MYTHVLQYTILRIAQSVLHFISWQTCSIEYHLGFSGERGEIAERDKRRINGEVEGQREREGGREGGRGRERGGRERGRERGGEGGGRGRESEGQRGERE